jgi:cell pole-organizing protein PopZ
MSGQTPPVPGSAAPGAGNPAKPGSDPSMEDILASIRRILSEEEGNQDAPAANDPGADAGKETRASATEEDDVLALDESMLVQPDSPAPPSPTMGLGMGLGSMMGAAEDDETGAALLAEAETAAVLEESSVPAPEEPFGEAFEEPSEPEALAPGESGLGSVLSTVPPSLSEFSLPAEPSPYSLVAPEAAAAAATAMSQLVRSLQAERHAAVYRGGPTLEDVVREEIRPVLKVWLDTHLPGIVERIVRAEIERLAGRAVS